MRKWTILILFIINSIYILAGAFIFSAIESRDDISYGETVEDLVLAFVDNRSCIPSFETESFVRTISQQTNVGLSGFNETPSFSDWSFSSSMLFAVTAITTIGYGHVAPVTALGRTVCVFYLILGIPLMTSLLAGIGGNLSKVIEAKLQARIWLKCNRKVDLFVKFFTVDLLLTSAVIYIPAAVFSHVEGWTYGDAVYYAFTTLTTVGFGDLYITPKEHVWLEGLNKLFTEIWILLGLAVISTMINFCVNCLSGKMDSQIEKCGNKITVATVRAKKTSEDG